MTQAQESRYKTALEAKRDELIREIGIRRKRLVIDHASDPMDRIHSVADRELAVGNMGRMCSLLRHVDNALGEIRDGTFGICAECDGQIAAARLEALPWSPYCVNCQERIEKEDHYAIAS